MCIYIIIIIRVHTGLCCLLLFDVYMNGSLFISCIIIYICIVEIIIVIVMCVVYNFDIIYIISN